PLEKRLQALDAILKGELGHAIHLERRAVKRPVVVVTGRYELKPVSKERPWVHWSVDNADLGEPESGGGNGSLTEFLRSLSFVYGLRFLDETAGSGDRVVRWQQHGSSLRKDKLSEILANLARQTSLEFRREQRLVDAWLITQSSGSTTRKE